MVGCRWVKTPLVDQEDPGRVHRPPSLVCAVPGPPPPTPSRDLRARGHVARGPFVVPRDVRRLLHIHRFGNLDRTPALEQGTALRLGSGLFVVLRLNQTVAAGGIGTAVLRH